TGCHRREDASPAAVLDAGPPSARSSSSASPSSPSLERTGAAAAPPSSARTASNGCIVVHVDTLDGDDVDLDGIARSGTRGHPNGTSFTFFVLELPKRRCVNGLEETTTVDEVQLGGVAIESFAPYEGKRVRVLGRAFPEHTAWHARPVLVD